MVGGRGAAAHVRRVRDLHVEERALPCVDLRHLQDPNGGDRRECDLREAIHLPRRHPAPAEQRRHVRDGRRRDRVPHCGRRPGDLQQAGRERRRPHRWEGAGAAAPQAGVLAHPGRHTAHPLHHRPGSRQENQLQRVREVVHRLRGAVAEPGSLRLQRIGQQQKRQHRSGEAAQSAPAIRRQAHGGRPCRRDEGFGQESRRADHLRRVQGVVQRVAVLDAEAEGGGRSGRNCRGPQPLRLSRPRRPAEQDRLHRHLPPHVCVLADDARRSKAGSAGDVRVRDLRSLDPLDRGLLLLHGQLGDGHRRDDRDPPRGHGIDRARCRYLRARSAVVSDRGTPGRR
mmetsp:Transcript_13269/g.49217  ORF Transcript_13269/g.49217 Transcript_13269/m.49217 type:complete len:341 (+) Transcript_13269:851-1873(+)